MVKDKAVNTFNGKLKGRVKNKIKKDILFNKRNKTDDDNNNIDFSYDISQNLKVKEIGRGIIHKIPKKWLLIGAATAVKLVTRSFPSNEIAKTDVEKTIINVIKYTFITLTTSCSTGFPSILIFLTLFGWMYEFSSFTMVLNKTTKRETLIPPPVLPAQAPTNINSTRIVFDVCGHRLKSAVEKPVVVIMEPT